MIFQELIDRAAPDKGNVWQYVSNHLASVATERIKGSNGDETILADEAANACVVRSLQDMLGDNYHPFLLPINQVQQFMFSKIETEDLELFFNMKMPFNHLFLDFHGTLRLDGENVKGVLVSRHTPQLANIQALGDIKNAHKKMNVLMVWAVTDNFMKGLNEHYPYYKISADGAQAWAFKDFEDKIPRLANLVSTKAPCMVIAKTDSGLRDNMDGEAKEFGEILRKIVIGFCLYVNSVNVEVIRVEGKMSKKRRKQGKRVPEPYYKCKLETKSVTMEEPRGDGSSHGYQYDVRGHFKHFKKGKMKGRTLWCPPHRRGLANEVYRPKTYHLIP